MIWAIRNDLRIEATPKNRAICPLCNEEVIAKCGKIKIWHWSHKSKFECDSFGEPDIEWHFNWKKRFPKENQEVRIENHRADIRTKSGLIIELQNSPISPDKIEEREGFYENMVWLLNGDKLAKGLDLREREGYFNFRWYHPSKSWWFAKKLIYIDLGICLFLVKKLYSSIPCGGWGVLVSIDDFILQHGGFCDGQGRT